MAMSLKESRKFKYKLISIKYFFVNKLKYYHYMLFLDLVLVISILSIPLLLNVTFFKKIISLYLLSLQNHEYKIAYIGLLGALIGTIVSITGTLAIQDYFNVKKDLIKQKENEQHALNIFHHLLRDEFFSNVNEILKLYEKYSNSDITLISVRLNQVKLSIHIDKYTELFRDIYNLYPKLGLTVSNVYKVIIKIKKEEKEYVTITKEEMDDFLLSYNMFQSNFNH